MRNALFTRILMPYTLTYVTFVQQKNKEHYKVVLGGHFSNHHCKYGGCLRAGRHVLAIGI